MTIRKDVKKVNIDYKTSPIGDVNSINSGVNTPTSLENNNNNYSEVEIVNFSLNNNQTDFQDIDSLLKSNNSNFENVTFLKIKWIMNMNI